MDGIMWTINCLGRNLAAAEQRIAQLEAELAEARAKQPASGE